MEYEQFLFTRNKRRDFTAFVRPADMTNKEVSLLASALNYITDVAALTAEQPGLYCFPLGAYTFVLRHYDSGRRHAGREIGVIEGIAVRAADLPQLADVLPDLIDQQAERLDVIGTLADPEDLEVRRSSVETYTAEPADQVSSEDDETLEFEIELPGEETNPPPADDLLSDADARLADEQLMLPFSTEGRDLLVEALKLSSTRLLHFAFGSNSDVVNRLTDAGADFDIVGYFGTTEPAFRPRAGKKAAAPVTPVRVEPPKPISLPPLVEPEPPVPMPARRQRRSLIGKLVGWLLGR